MAKKRNIESASVFERSGIRAIRVRAIEIRLYIENGVIILILYEVKGYKSSLLKC